jgi:hypothetical protein
MTTTSAPLQHLPLDAPKDLFGEFTLQNVTIRMLQQHKDLYYNIPARQRSPIWPRHKKQKWVDTLLRPSKFIPLDPIYFNKVWEVDSTGKRRVVYYIEDGLQRLSTIYLFLERKLSTFPKTEYRKRILIPQLNELPFEQCFSDLSEDMQQAFLERSLPIVVMENVDPVIADERYRRRNEGMQLSMGERLRSYQDTVASKFAEAIADHPFVASGMDASRRKDRQYRFELALYLIHMKVHGFPAGMTISTLELLAAGMSDYALSERVQVEMFQQLNMLAHIYDGADLTAKTDGIPPWQSFYYLQRAGCDFKASEKGCLRPWFQQTKIARLEGTNQGNLSTFAGMPYAQRQIEFWKRYKPILLDQQGLVFRDRDRWYRERHSDAIVLPLDPLPIDLESGLVLTEHDTLSL